MVTWSPSKVPYSSNSAQSPSPPASGACPPSVPSSVAPPPPQAVNTNANAALAMSALRTRELLTSCSLSYVVVRAGGPGVAASTRLRCGAANPCHPCNRLHVGESNDLRNDPATVFLPAHGRGAGGALGAGVSGLCGRGVQGDRAGRARGDERGGQDDAGRR